MTFTHYALFMIWMLNLGIKLFLFLSFRSKYPTIDCTSIFTSMSNRHLKFNTSKNKLLIFAPLSRHKAALF